MLKSWEIKNFKSYKNVQNISLNLINILAGANSSGKSTIIQSLLLLKQTVQYGARNRPLSLNGPLVRLGSFSDLKHFDASDETMEFNLHFNFGDSSLSNQQAPWHRSLTRATAYRDSTAFQSLEVLLSYCDSERDTLQLGQQVAVTPNLNPELRKTKLTVTRKSEGGQQVEFLSFDKTTYDIHAPYSIGSYSVEVDERTESEMFQNKSSPFISGGDVTYFFPTYTYVTHNSAVQRYLEVIAELFSPVGLNSRRAELHDMTLPAPVFNEILKWFKANGLSFDLDDGKTNFRLAQESIYKLKNSGNDLLDMMFEKSKKKKYNLAELRTKIVEIYKEITADELNSVLENPRVFAASNDFVTEYFRQGVRYLGPLRDSPKPVYAVDALESTTDVGYRGQHTAAVLDLNKDRMVSFHLPPESSSVADYVSNAKPARQPLRAAVVAWLKYLGVAEEVNTIDAGVYGNRLQVSVGSNGQFHDLTGVGVGVSQVLPLVVSALLAPASSLLIFEQPELHLHPRVQSRLADFFIALALDNKQTLLETHSENLVDRFRLRIAQSEDGRLKSLINILFSEKENSESRLVPVEISEYGAIVNWPRDFFDQTQEDVTAIIKAASEKRRKRSSQKGAN